MEECVLEQAGVAYFKSIFRLERSQAMKLTIGQHKTIAVEVCRRMWRIAHNILPKRNPYRSHTNGASVYDSVFSDTETARQLTLDVHR